MQKGQMSLQEVPVGLLVAHPENSNFMNEETREKLLRHVKRSGRYEPLTVRPHPNEQGKFQVINGHNRLSVLQALGRKTALCAVWNIDDDEARLYLATLNRLSGNDVPERRAMLLEKLLTTFDVDELAGLVPDGRNQLEELRRISQVQPDEVIDPSACREEFSVPVILTFMLQEAEADDVTSALDVAADCEEEHISRSQGLLRLARFYLGHRQPAEVKESRSYSPGVRADADPA